MLPVVCPLAVVPDHFRPLAMNLPSESPTRHRLRALGKKLQVLSCESGEPITGDTCPDCGKEIKELVRALGRRRKARIEAGD